MTLHKILSYLDISEVIATSGIAKRWRYTWRGVLILNITADTTSRFKEKKKFPGLLNFVDRVFMFRDNSEVNRFKIVLPNCYKGNLMMESILTWIYALSKRNVQEIYLEVNNTRLLDFKFPKAKELFHSKSLNKLEMRMTDKELASITFPELMCLPQLKLLSLHSFVLSSMDSANNLFASCPVLETLVLDNIDIYITDAHQNFVISCSELQHLEIKSIWYLESLEFQNSQTTIQKPIHLDVPKLTKFICQDFLFRENYHFISDLSSLVTADVAMFLDETYVENHVNEYGDKVDEDSAQYSKLSVEKRDDFAQRMLKLLGSLHAVKELKLSPGVLEVLVGAPGLLDSQPRQFCNMQYLKLEMWLTGGCACVITYLLELSPNLESLYLTLKESNLQDAFDDSEQRFSRLCVLAHLKSVEISEAKGYDTELKLLEFLLKNGVALEQLTLHFVYQMDRDFEVKIRSLPRASSSIDMRFHYPLED
ncbi:hypothetical protein C5167_046423 [Papaver somniferum]|uniref:FBD domain-containing protein n=1 Tax=Papaver somniferum TaxID=3469 RepID=A0A4Y7LEH0_PAPSO|nr:F-box/FBD/LRR-repeat protein At5g22700-like [Papaver somniferum]RZC83636.1 hypothetical protein C5167_046423 [Papaver somniferum]